MKCVRGNGQLEECKGECKSRVSTTRRKGSGCVTAASSGLPAGAPGSSHWPTDQGALSTPCRAPWGGGGDGVGRTRGTSKDSSVVRQLSELQGEVTDRLIFF